MFKDIDIGKNIKIKIYENINRCIDNISRLVIFDENNGNLLKNMKI